MAVSKRSARCPAGVLVGVLSFIGLACGVSESGSTNFRQDVLLCEEAVSHLEKCCPGFDDVGPTSCDYIRGGCDSNDQNVALSPITSRCIRNESCDDLIQSGACERAELLLTGMAEYDASTDPAHEVCTP